MADKSTPCRHCRSIACANGGNQMSGYWVTHPGCDKARADKGLPPFVPLDAKRKPEDDEAFEALDQD